MRMSERKLRELLNSNKSLRCSPDLNGTATNSNSKSVSQGKEKKEFDSLAEKIYYYEYLYPLYLTNKISNIDIHKSFKITDKNPIFPCIRERIYTPDFVLHFPDGNIKIVEVKGDKIKKLQREYPLKRDLLLLQFCIPNGWDFEEVKAELLTTREYDPDNIFKRFRKD
jgi:hypothetical protein